MNIKLNWIIAIAILGLVTGLCPAAEPVCNTTTSNKCTSGGEACTVTKKVCTTFNPDGTTKIETTTSHDCGPGGPKDCPKTGSGSATRSHYAIVSSTKVTTKAPTTGPIKPKLPVTRVSPVGARQQQTPTPTPTPRIKRPLKADQLQRR